MALPKQVQAALDAADATLAAANGQTPPEAPLVAPTSDVVPQPEPFSQAAPQPEVVAEPPQPAQPKPDVWEARYKSLQGIFDKTVPALQAEVKTLKSDLTLAIEKLNEAGQRQASAPQPQQAMDPKDVENFGDDLVAMVARVAGASMAKATSVFDSRIAAIEGAVVELQRSFTGASQRIELTAEQAFFDKVTKLVPNWEQVNADQGFIVWLGTPDPVYGIPRQAALDKARGELNADHASAIFKAYLATVAPTPQGPDPLEKQVSPKGAATPQPTPNAPVFLKASDITAFYDSVRRGEYRGNEAEATRIEGIINLALSEGRVTN